MYQASDQYDLPITGADAATAAGYDAYVTEFLSYGSELRALFDIADANTHAPLINAHAAALHLAFEGAEGWEAARVYLDRMERHEGDATERERLFCGAVRAWARLDFNTARAALDELTVRWPGDLCAIKWGQYHAFNLGDAGALLRFGERARIAHENRPYAHGMIAFALEQNHRLNEAEEEGLHATEIAIDDAWAHHAVAHVMETAGRARDGAHWLDHCAHTWDRKGVFIRDHNWWHAALFRLTLGQNADAVSIFDKRLWGEWPEFPQEQIGAVSMLWRLELRGADVGARWEPIVEQVRMRMDDHLLPFHDLHYLYALARAGTGAEADAFLTGMRRRGELSDDAAGDVWTEVAAPTGEAIIAFLRGDKDKAAKTLRAVAPSLHRIGGSHAQRHVFDETIEACGGEAGFASGRES